MTDKAPERIYLQWTCDESDESPPWDGDVTWCRDKIHSDDVQYVRVDLVKPKQASSDD